MGLVVKTDHGYTLGARGLLYVGHDAVARQELADAYLGAGVALVVQNGEGDILLQRRPKQPFIDTWDLPRGVVCLDDASLAAAAARTARDVLGRADTLPERAGDCYVRVFSEGQCIAMTFTHVFRLYTDTIVSGGELMWARPHKLHLLELAPAVEEIMTRTFFKDPFYFEEFEVTWGIKASFATRSQAEHVPSRQ